MKKIKEFYNENRVFTILMGIVIICVVLIASVMLKYFFFGNGSNPYGDRLKDAKKYAITDKLKNDITTSLESDEAIKNASIKVIVRTVYIQMEFNQGVALKDAEGKALSVLEKFSEGQMGYYDIEFILTEESTNDSEGFTIMGAKNVNGSNIVWNNNNPITIE